MRITDALEESANEYDWRMAELEKIDKAKADAASKAGKERQARAVCFPLLSKNIPPEESISLENELVETWATGAVTKVIQSHNELG